MNKHLEKLAIKNGFVHKHMSTSERNDALAKFERIAKAIVQECVKIADDGYGSDHFGNGIAGYQLLDHFGIEK